MAKIRHVEDVDARRKKEYPPLEELADALYHERMGNPAPMETYLTKCGQVKTRFPKPAK